MKKIFSYLTLLLFITNIFVSSVFAVEDNVKKVIEQKKDINTGDKKNNVSLEKKEEKTIKGKIKVNIEAWKKKKQQIIRNIYAQTNIASLMDLTKATNQLKDISSKLEDVSFMYKTIKVQKKNTDKKYKELLNEVKNVYKDLKNKKKELKKILFRLQILSKELKDLKKQLKDLKQTIYISKKQVEKYIVLLYKISNDYYSKQDGLDSLKLLLKSNKNIAKTLSEEDIIKILSLQTKELISKLDKAEKRKKAFLKKMFYKRAEYVNLLNQYNSEIKILNSKRKVLVSMLKVLNSNKKELDKYYKQIIKKRAKLKKEQIRLAKSVLRKYENNLSTGTNITGASLKAKPIDLSDVISHTIKIDGDKFLSWPTKDAIAISAYFHDEKYKKLFGYDHDAIDIRLRQNSPVYAPAAGYVYKVVDNNSNYYNYIVLVHNYGYITLYGHISKALVKEGQIVERGQIIALSGGKKGTRGSGKLSTGPHLHFEVYKNGQLIDPFSVLDLSVYPDKKYLPLKWRIKYMKDNITRKIDLSNVKMYSFKIPHKKRQEMFLKRAAKPYQNVDLWLKAGKKYGIDPDVAICIAYAESGIGRNITTKNNIGNVGNNDRGDRVGLATPEDGINSIFYTLNNKYLSKYHTIYRLSRYGNKEKHIYSSSTYNWYKNVVKCLATIKGYPIDEYYPFRTIPESTMNALSAKYNNLR